MALTEDQVIEIEKLRIALVRWCRGFWIGPAADIGPHRYQEAIRYAFLKSRSADFMEEDWMMQHIRCALAGDGEHLLRQDVQDEMKLAMEIGPHGWRANKSGSILWPSALHGTQLWRTEKDSAGLYQPERFDPAVPDHGGVTAPAVLERVVGFSL